MSKQTWDVTIDDQPHQIEFSISPWTNKRSILVDGSKVDLPKEQRKIQWDTGTKHEFVVAGHEVKLPPGHLVLISSLIYVLMEGMLILVLQLIMTIKPRALKKQ
jgi:hypothetical protein